MPLVIDLIVSNAIKPDIRDKREKSLPKHQNGDAIYGTNGPIAPEQIVLPKID